MRKVVETREQSENEGDGYVEEEEEQVFYGGGAGRPIVEKIEEDEGEDAEEGARSADGGCAFGCVIAAEDVAHDTCADVHECEAQTTNLLLHVPAQGHLQQQVEPDMDKPRMHEDRRDEAPPLVRLEIWLGRTVLPLERRVLLWHTAHAAELRDVAGGGCGCGVWTRPEGDVVVEHFLHVVHAGLEAGAHVDEDVGGGADHDVEVWLGLDGGACQDACVAC